MGWGEARAGSGRLNWRTLIGVKHTWSTIFCLFSCFQDESSHRLTAAKGCRSRSCFRLCASSKDLLRLGTFPHLSAFSHPLERKIRCLKSKCYNFRIVWFGRWSKTAQMKNTCKHSLWFVFIVKTIKIESIYVEIRWMGVEVLKNGIIFFHLKQVKCHHLKRLDLR